MQPNRNHFSTLHPVSRVRVSARARASMASKPDAPAQRMARVTSNDTMARKLFPFITYCASKRLALRAKNF